MQGNRAGGAERRRPRAADGGQAERPAERQADRRTERPAERRAAPARAAGSRKGEALGGPPGGAPLGPAALRRLGLAAALGALWVLGGCGGGVSGEIGRACMTSGQEAANPQLCACVQGIANQTLSASEQRRAARFFSDPDEAQSVRASDSQRDEAFWERYRGFADRAEAICG